MKLRASVLREQLPKIKKCDCKFGDECRWIHPRSEAEAPVIGSLDLIKGSQGRITPDTSATSCARVCRKAQAMRPTSTRRKVIRPDGTPYRG